MDTARYSNYLSPDYDPPGIRSESKGKNGVGILAIGYNEPKGQESLGGKVTRVVIEHYMRRPTLKEEGLQKITEFAHDAICVQQAPGYQAECALGILMTQGDQFRWIVAGDVRIMHFLNGQLMTENKGNAPRLGSGKTKEMPEVLEATSLQKGENSFLICSESFVQYVREAEIENALSMAENAEEWLRILKDLYEDRCRDGEPFALMTVFMPQKRKWLSRKAVIAIIIAAVVLCAGIFVAMGAMRRKNGPGPGQRPPQMEQGGPGMEPTQPPEPEAPPEGQGGGAPGEQPTRPPKPTQPPAPEQPEPAEDQAPMS